MKSETLTLVLVNLAGIMERADESLLPGVYKEVGVALHTDPTGLGSLTLFRSIVQSSCYPLAAYLAVRHNRAHVIALGAFLWAAATFLVAFSSTFLQISSGSAIPFAAILLLVLPDDPSTAFSHGLVLFLMGCFVSWNAPATNNPIFAEIVPEKSRTCIYALDQSFESILASFAPPLVGILAQHVYGYKPTRKGSPDSIQIETDRENAKSLAKALYTATGIPMTICCFIYTFLYCTYPRDRERAKMTALIESEIHQLGAETDTTSPRKEYSEILVSESKEVDEKEMTEIGMEYGGDDDKDIALDDNDKKSLLS
ncbi:hypothetical protein FEM48_Zijuj08G0163200 [Ziziphus jujuba var. spinosa]|uniref:Uncharacterized protein n=1 Tax=Ziziphus jujuba var. spinosa TaxID=714518 RepID=A0A978V043_ZIZJJ|nr:hypothetical protein FEM48_Zijuj08G0163200 [Ziziphus jujuba var. spinosa]